MSSINGAEVPANPLWGASAEARSQSACRILICDDHDLVRWGLKKLLRKSFRDAEIAEATDGREALQLFDAGPWSVVLLDIKLPGRGGMDVLAQMKKARPEMPVLILSGMPLEEFAVRSLRSGAAGFIPKTSVVSELVPAIRLALEGGKYISSSVADEIALRAASPGGLGTEPVECLSNREYHVFHSLARGRPIKEIAAELSLSPKTVSTYRARVCTKLGLKTESEMTRHAMEHGLLD